MLLDGVRVLFRGPDSLHLTALNSTTMQAVSLISSARLNCFCPFWLHAFKFACSLACLPEKQTRCLNLYIVYYTVTIYKTTWHAVVHLLTNQRKIPQLHGYDVIYVLSWKKKKILSRRCWIIKRKLKRTMAQVHCNRNDTLSATMRPQVQSSWIGSNLCSRRMSGEKKPK